MSKRIAILDYGRFLAAFGVMAYHYFAWAISNQKITSLEAIDWLADLSRYGYFGIQFFFMISGYVIFFSARNRTAADFAVSRALRLYPAFWVAVSLTAVCSLAFGSIYLSIEPSQFIANLTMMPKSFGFEYVDGVYWTLKYEVTFYTVVFLLLLFGFSQKLEQIFLWWAVLIGLFAVANQGEPKFFGGWYVYFAAGTSLALAKSRRDLLTLVAVLSAFIACLKHALEFAAERNESLLIIGIMLTLCFLLLFAANSEKGANLRLPKSNFLGGLTYPVYLLHAEIGYMVISHFGNATNRVFIYLFTIALICSLAAVIHIVIEKRMYGTWRTFFDQSVGRSVRLLDQKIGRNRT